MFENVAKAAEQLMAVEWFFFLAHVAVSRTNEIALDDY